MSDPRTPDEILGYYALGGEQGRLDDGYFPLERARTQDLVRRHLQAPPGRVLDVGGGAGAYAFWLAELGYEVHLVDPVPLHVRQAEEPSRARETGRLTSARVGDARRLDFADASADTVLLLGPLYHLTDRADRLAALAQARRVLKPGGVVFAAGISRFASLLDGLRGPVFDDDAFTRIVELDLADGQHRNETGGAEFFTTAFFHHPGELAAELREAGLDLVRRVEREPALLGASPHLLAVGRR